MSSINTNIAAMTALQALNQTNKETLVTQNRVATGYRVANASDNAAYWSIATTMRSDRLALSTVADALGLGAATVDVANQGITSAIDTASKIKSKLVAARQPGVDRAKIQAEIEQLQSSLQSSVDTATFSGQNWLSVDSTGTTTRSLVASFSRDGAGAITIGTISVDVGATGSMLVDSSGGGQGILDSDKTVTSGGTYTILSLDISTLTDDSADLDDLEDYISGVDEAITAMTNAATDLGAVKTRIDLQKEFAKSLMDAIDKGVGQLVDADMNEESTRLQALQVRSQLGVQSLSMANQSAQSILQLFQ
ncbi:flagellin [Hyphomicrobium sp. LHD-15]|uniref:flagellin N-terminal helical domain-containing protein n=1 Tax=Hyphomicrobium sp. LHD-15 TaxID=3072142 RepID=UPI00280C941E|nr:flagellin [Hyphomicrobium sp. LHD-15]MDQ8699091.1 flagellin [Hyphomicrobium sp. LHD-15]